MKSVKVISYSRTSISAKNIARFNHGKNRIQPNKNYVGGKGDLIVNWGFTGPITAFDPHNEDLLNMPENVAAASSKTRCFEVLEEAEVPTLEFYTDRTELEEAMLGDDEQFDDKIYCRTLTRAHSGKGIVVANNKSEIVNAPLYTIEFKNDIEFRVHVFNGKIIDVVQKRRMSSERRERLGIDDVIDDVRNLNNGWSFVRSRLTLKNESGDFVSDLFHVPIDATKALGLDFAAVDLLYNSDNDEAVVCEINTAPGMKVGTTTHYRYIKAIQEYAGNDFDLESYNKRYDIDFNNSHEGNLEEFINIFTVNEA